MRFNHFEYEAWLHFTMNDACEVWEMEGDRFFDLIEKYKPDLYEAFAAHLANKEVEEFLSNKSKDDHNDYYQED
jgi:hypothetical protein